MTKSIISVAPAATDITGSGKAIEYVSHSADADETFQYSKQSFGRNLKFLSQSLAKVWNLL